MSKSVNLDLIPKIAKTNPANAILMLTTYLKLEESKLRARAKDMELEK